MVIFALSFTILTRGWGKHFLVQTKEATNSKNEKYVAKDDVKDKLDDTLVAIKGNGKNYGNKDYGNEDYGNEDHQIEDHGNEDYGNEKNRNEDYGKEEKRRGKLGKNPCLACLNQIVFIFNGGLFYFLVQIFGGFFLFSVHF